MTGELEPESSDEQRSINAIPMQEVWEMFNIDRATLDKLEKA